jgi:uncharacterized protein
MNATTERRFVAGPAGALECALDALQGSPRGLAVLCHPHPLHGGAMDNKVVHTLARALVQLGWRVARFNFRGVGQSAGVWDEGRGEVDDALAVIQALRAPGEALALGGFSFGGYVASQVAARLPDADKPQRLALIAPAVENFPMANVSPDTLVVHGEHDDVVPLAALLNWARPQSLPVTVIPGAVHFFHGQLPTLKNIVLGAWR